MVDEQEDDEYVVEGFFVPQYGWEEVVSEDNEEDIKQRLKEYRENDPQHQYRWRKLGRK